MAGKGKCSPEQVEKMAQLRAKGYSFRMIGTRYGITERTAQRLVKAHNERKEADGQD